MSDQVQKKSPSEQSGAEAETTAAKDLKDEKLAEETDVLLDEIDELLDEARGELTADEFCLNFVQRGGE